MSSDVSARSPPSPHAAVLATFAIATAIVATLAFWKQSREVRDMAEMLKVQSERLADQRRINEEHAKVLELQAGELRESLAERQRETEQRHRAQASCVFITQARHPTAPRGYPNRKASARW
jgi:hypothetical protein